MGHREGVANLIHQQISEGLQGDGVHSPEKRQKELHEQ